MSTPGEAARTNNKGVGAKLSESRKHVRTETGATKKEYSLSG